MLRPMDMNHVKVTSMYEPREGDLDVQVIIDRQQKLQDLRLFYRDAQTKVDLIRKTRTRNRLESYEYRLAQLTGWRDMQIDHDRMICLDTNEESTLLFLGFISSSL